MIDKVRENRLRRQAARRGFRLMKSRQRDLLGLNYATWTLYTEDGVKLGDRLSLNDVEHIVNKSEVIDPNEN